MTAALPPTAAAGGDSGGGDERTRLEDLEIELLLEAVHRHYGFDFREYSRASVRRRLRRRAYAEGVHTISALTARLLHDQACMERLLRDLSISVTSMFRDAGFFKALREKVVPLLRTYPFVRIWNAGCATGEETLSLAILLTEEGVYDRTRIYATDINGQVLAQARTGVFPLSKMREYTENYLAAGGRRSFSEYYLSKYDGAQFSRALLDNVVFAQHNLVSDRSFNEFQLIVCRNVMIYFDRSLQQRVHALFYDSLSQLGVLALGPKESLRYTSYNECFEPLDDDQRIYRRLR